MTLNEKIKDSVQMTTGLRCFEGTPPDSVTGRFAYFFQLRSGAAKRYNEVAVFFVERPVFAPLDPERATVDCRYLALDWLNGLYAYSGLKFQEIISQNNIRDGFGGYGVGMRLVLVDEARNTGGGSNPKPILNYFRITAYSTDGNDGTVTVGWSGQTRPPLEYSHDGKEWNDFLTDFGLDVIQQYSRVDSIVFRIKEGYTWSPTSNSNHFNIYTDGSGNVKAVISGNIMSLVDATMETTTIPIDNCFSTLFCNCRGIVSAENLELPATTLTRYCYRHMFYGCTSLTTAPALPAKTLALSCYENMFFGCTSLTVAPALPATTLANYCYSDMFYGCTSLTAAPALPATTLAQYCYLLMFAGCTALETAPELPATTLVNNCYNQMFVGCTALTEAPELPATTLADNCYGNMFAECSSLETAPELPATTLADGCYSYMFRACTSLETAPELQATTLVNNCYQSMFIGCTSLDYIKVNFTTWSTATEFWAENVAESGTFECPDGLSIVYDRDHIPTGWRVVKPTMYNVLAVSGDQTMGSVTGGGSYAVGDTVTLTATALDGYNFVNWTVNNVEVSTSETYTFTVSQAVTVQGNFEEAASYMTFNALQDNSSVGWYSSTYPNLEYSTDGSTWTAFTSPVSVNTGGKVMFRNNGTAWTATSGSSHFTTTGSFDLSGNIMSLVDATMESTTIPIVRCFIYLFSSCNGIITAHELILPATTLTSQCYQYMFYSCTSLTTAPDLPAMTLAQGCYQYMFIGCTSLTIAPDLPATTMYYNCYNQMFTGCTSLTIAPDLPATTLNVDCYSSMFRGCTSLTTAPSILPATTLSDFCYSSMFQGCTSLTTAPELPATALAERCYNSMFQGCTSLTTAPELPATTIQKGCYSNMFQGCTSLTTAPELPATGTLSNCYYYMFYGCASLNYIKCLATSLASGSTTGWVNGVSATGTFVKDASTNWPTGGNGIPSGWTVQNA